MKRIIPLLLIILILSIQAFAQIGKTKFISETNFNYVVENSTRLVQELRPGGGPWGSFVEVTKDNKDTRFSISESIGYSVSDRIVVGVGFAYSRFASKQYGQNPLLVVEGDIGDTLYVVESIPIDRLEEKTVSIKSGLFVSYFLPFSKRFNFVPRFDFQYEKSTYAHDFLKENGAVVSSLAPSTKANYLNYALSASVLFKVADWFGIQAKVFNTRFRHTLTDSTVAFNEREEANNFDFNVNPLKWEYGFVFIIGKNKS